MNTTQLTYHSLLQRLHAVRKKEKFISLIAGIFVFITAILLMLLAALTVNALFFINSSGRITIDAILVGLAVVIFLYFIFRPVFSLLFRKQFPSNFNLADRIGNKFPTIKDRLVNALQVFDFYNRNPEGYSTDLVKAALTEVDEDSKDKDFLGIISKTAVIRAARFFTVSVILFLLSSFIFSASFNSSANQLLHPFTSFAEQAKFKLLVTPGDTEVLKNENVEIKVVAEGEVPQQITLHLKNVNNGNELTKVLTNNKKDVFLHKIESIKDSTEYYVSAENIVTPQYQISVIELPMVRNLQLKLTSPQYSRIETEFLDENVGDVAALKGSVADIKIQANKNLLEAKLVFENNKEQKLTAQGNSARGKFNILSDDTYYISLEDLESRGNQDPIVYRINVIEDGYPAVKITVPGQDVDITEEMLIMLTIEAEDDFGFSHLQLAYKVLIGGSEIDNSFSNIPLKPETYNVENFRFNYNWDLSGLNLFPEDVVTYYVEVFDNDNISGPKSAKSLTYNIHFPSIDEMFSEVEQKHEQAFETLEGMYEKSKELKEKVSELVQEMKKDPNLNWEEKKQLEDVVETQQQMQQALEEVEQKLDEMIERMEKNDLVSLETLKKYQELQELMQELMTDELKEAIKELQQAMEDIDPEELRKAVEKLDLNQEEFLKSLEKNLEILKRLQIEQRLDELAKKAEQLLKEQKELLDKAKDSEKECKNKSAKEQQELKQKTEQLKKDIESLKEKMSQFADMPTDRLDAATDMMDREQLTQNMQQASQMFKSGNMGGAKKKCQNAQNSLSELADMLKSAKKELIQAQKQQVMSELKNISHGLLSLSMNQENVLKTGEGLGRNSPQLGKVADRQQDLANGLGRVAEKTGELSKKTFFVTPEMVRSIGKSLTCMQQALNNLEERDGKRATRKQGESMHALNEAIKQVRKSMNDLSASSSASGMQEMMEKLSQMSCNQQGINQQTMKLGMGQQQISMQQQAAMARLAAEQAALKKSLEQLQQEYGNRSDVLGRLDKIAEDMEDVVKDLKSRNVSRKTKNRQKKILSRLLDAQKSVQRRDYSRKRKAETGKNYFAKSPAHLPANLWERDYELRQDLLKALKQGYTKDYQELIKKYFEALANEKSNN